MFPNTKDWHGFELDVNNQVFQTIWRFCVFFIDSRPLSAYESDNHWIRLKHCILLYWVSFIVIRFNAHSYCGMSPYLIFTVDVALFN